MARTIKHPGLNRHARALGCSPGHLSQVADATRKSPELLARYHALVAADPSGTGGVRAAFLPANETTFENCEPSMLETARQEFGDAVRIEGDSLVLLRDFVLTVHGQRHRLETLTRGAQRSRGHGRSALVIAPAMQIEFTPESLALIERLRRAPFSLREAIGRGLEKGAQAATANIQETRLMGEGPYPVEEHRLGVGKSRPGHIAGNLRRSTFSTPPVITGDTVTVRIGTPVFYAAIHEFGADYTRTSQAGDVRLRTDRRGNLVKRGNLATFAKKTHKLARKVSYAGGKNYAVHVAARAPFGHGIADNLPKITAAVVREVRDAGRDGRQMSATPLHPIAEKSAAGDFKLPSDGFYEICPRGEFPHVASGLCQVIDQQAIDAMAAAFKPGEQLLVDFDHFSWDQNQRTEAAGWIYALSARPSSLKGQIRWTTAGLEAVTGGNYKFLSPVFRPEDCEQLGGNRVRPLRLTDAGLTNRPGLTGIAALTNRSGDSSPDLSKTDAEVIAIFDQLTRALQKQKGCSFERAYSATKRASPAAWEAVSAIHSKQLASL